MIRRSAWAASHSGARLGGSFPGVTRSAERLEVLVVMGALVDQRNDVVEFPAGLAWLVAAFTNCAGPSAADLAQLSSDLVRIDTAACAASSIPLANSSASFPGVAGVVDVDTLLVPAATSVDAALLVSGFEEDLLSTPAADSLGCIAKGNLGTSMGCHSAIQPVTT